MVFVSPSVPGARPSNSSADSVRVTSFVVASDISPGAIAIVGPAGTLAQAAVARAAAKAQVSRNMAGVHLVTEELVSRLWQTRPLPATSPPWQQAALALRAPAMHSGAMQGDWQNAIEPSRAPSPFLELALPR